MGFFKWFKSLFSGAKNEQSEQKTADEVKPLNPTPPMDVVKPAPVPPQIVKPSDLPPGGHYPSTEFKLLCGEYVYNFSICIIRPEVMSELTFAMAQIEKYKDLYEEVEKLTKVPWWVVALLDYREESFDHTCYLGNGDPLHKPTTNVPQGRGPFKTWIDGAVDALKYDNITNNKDWSIGPTCWWLEIVWNGSGYRKFKGRFTTPMYASPYIYAGTQFYEKGKYTWDRRFNPEKIDRQLGCMTILKALEQKGSVKL